MWVLSHQPTTRRPRGGTGKSGELKHRVSADATWLRVSDSIERDSNIIVSDSSASERDSLRPLTSSLFYLLTYRHFIHSQTKLSYRVLT